MKIKTAALAAAFALLGLALGRYPAGAADFSFTGTFAEDNDVQPFAFTVGALSTVTLRTWSYAGGTNAAGASIARGGFDPILALFGPTGAFIDQNDDGGCGSVAADALTGECWDTFLQATLPAGTYTVAIMEYDNFAVGPNFSDGFTRDGQGNFTDVLGGDNDFTCDDDPDNLTPFHDVSHVSPGCLRDSHWAFDILNVNAAVIDPPVPQAPEPATLALLGAGLTAFGLARRRKAAA